MGPGHMRAAGDFGADGIVTCRAYGPSDPADEFGADDAAVQQLVSGVQLTAVVKVRETS